MSQNTETFLTTNDLAKRWQISPKALNHWRKIKNGPSFFKIGKRVLYRQSDVENFEAENLQNHSVA